MVHYYVVEEDDTCLPDHERVFKELTKASPDYDLVESLIKANPSLLTVPRHDGSLALHIACFNALVLTNLEFIRFLVDNFFDAIRIPNNFGLLPIHKAVSCASLKHMNTMKYLIELYPGCLLSKLKDGSNIFHLAIVQPRSISIEILEYLISVNPSGLLQPDNFGELPLHKAAAKLKIDIQVINLLIQSAPASTWLKDRKGFLPIHWTLSKRQPNVETIFALSEAYAEGLLELDYEEKTPVMRYLLNPDKEKEIEEAILELTELARENIKSKAEERKISSSSPPRSSPQRARPPPLIKRGSNISKLRRQSTRSSLSSIKSTLSMN